LVLWIVVATCRTVGAKIEVSLVLYRVRPDDSKV